MKKLSYLFLFLSSLLSAQYSSTNMFYDYIGDNILNAIVIPYVIVMVVAIAIYYIIALAEARNKTEDYSTKQYNADIWVTLVVYFLLVLLVIFIISSYGANPYLVLIPARTIGAIISAKSAGKKQRNKILWFFLGFIEYHAALIVLALTKGILLTKKGGTAADLLYNNKYEKINALFGDKLITAHELEKKKTDLEKEFRENLLTEKNEQAEREKQEYYSKLQKALDDGLLTQEEYKSKLNSKK